MKNEPQNEPQNINNKVAKRKNEILKLINKDNSMSKEAMAEHIGCSLSTIKRDLKELQKDGVIVSNNIRTGEGTVEYV